MPGIAALLQREKPPELDSNGLFLLGSISHRTAQLCRRATAFQEPSVCSQDSRQSANEDGEADHSARTGTLREAEEEAADYWHCTKYKGEHAGGRRGTRRRRSGSGACSGSSACSRGGRTERSIHCLCVPTHHLVEFRKGQLTFHFMGTSDHEYDAPPSLKPAKRYCDVTGLEAPYTDPKSRLRYHNADI